MEEIHLRENFSDVSKQSNNGMQTTVAFPTLYFDLSANPGSVFKLLSLFLKKMTYSPLL